MEIPIALRSAKFDTRRRPDVPALQNILRTTNKISIINRMLSLPLTDLIFNISSELVYIIETLFFLF